MVYGCDEEDIKNIDKYLVSCYNLQIRFLKKGIKMTQEQGEPTLQDRYSKLLSGLLEGYGICSSDREMIVVCTSEAKKEEAKKEGFSPVYIDPKMELGDDAVALTMAYQLKMILTGDCHPYADISTVLTSTLFFDDMSVFSQKAQPELWNFCDRLGGHVLEGRMDGALHFAILLLETTQYSVGQALSDYDKKVPIDIELMNTLRQQPSLLPEEKEKRNEVYFRILGRKLNREYGVRLLNNNPRFKKVCHVLNWYFGEDVCVVDVPESQKEAFDNAFEKGEHKGCGQFFSMSLEICQSGGVKDGVNGMTDEQVAFSLIKSVVGAKIGKRHVVLTSPKGNISEENHDLVRLVHKCGYSVPDILVDCLKGHFCSREEAVDILKAVMMVDDAGKIEFDKAVKLANLLTKKKVADQSGEQGTEKSVRKGHTQGREK